MDGKQKSSKTKYYPRGFEEDIVGYWEKNGVYKTPDGKSRNNTYILSMFPFLSGEGIHTGHARIYTGCDVLARYLRMKGKSILYPMGWDAFGLPAENAAIKKGNNPQDETHLKISNFKRQMKKLGLSYDWDREFSTADPKYYKWTQWLFIQFYKLGLLYKKDTSVYFCPSCKTGLAEEEVLANGCHERCNKQITRKKLSQWIFRITKYADSLLAGMDGLDWPKGILQMQKNWIGRKSGINIDYDVKDANAKITCFTTRPDTNFGATFIVLAPEHQFISELGTHVSGLKTQSQRVKAEKYVDEVNRYVETALSKTELERISDDKQKTGVFTGFYAINSLNKALMPIWVSDFVLSGFGTGAIVGVPGHDKRDFEFAKEFGLDIKRVVASKNGEASDIVYIEQVQEGEGYMINSDFLNGLDVKKAIDKMTKYLEKKKIGKKTTTYHLRDWIFSRQRYWGEPIPMIYCEKCHENGVSYWSNKSKNLIDIIDHNNTKMYQKASKNIEEIEDSMMGWFPMEENKLPLELPYIKSYKVSEKCESPLGTDEKWLNVTCPNCNGTARRELDTMPNWAGSCWYFLEFAKKNFFEGISNKSRLINNLWLPVDWYFGGSEHSVLHLLYARFWTHILNDVGILPFREPFSKFKNVGMVLSEDHRKMSKSLGNVVNPDDVVKEYGADAVRIYVMFMAPFSQEVTWSTQTLQGSYRFIARIWQIYNGSDNITDDENKEDKTLVIELQKLIIKVTSDITNVKFNTAIAAMMKYINKWQKCDNKKPRKLTKLNSQKFLKLLAPFAPFASEKIWLSIFGSRQSIHLSDWPKVDKKLVKDKIIPVPVQVDGRVRGILKLSLNNIEKKEVVKRAIELESVAKWIGGRKYNVYYKKGKIINLVGINKQNKQ